jgi:hypothetical protein
MKSIVLKVVSIIFILITFGGCTMNQIGTTAGGAAGAGTGYAVTGSGWGAAIGGGAGALLGHELTKNKQQ